MTPSRRQPNFWRNRATLVSPGGVIAVRRCTPYWRNGTASIPEMRERVNHFGVADAMLTMTFPYWG